MNLRRNNNKCEFKEMEEEHKEKVEGIFKSNGKLKEQLGFNANEEHMIVAPFLKPKRKLPE